MTEEARNDDGESSDPASNSSSQDDRPNRLRSLTRAQRRLILLRLLYHRYQRNRLVLAENNREVLQAAGPLRVLKHNEALACGALCRFCLAQASEMDPEEAEGNPFVSPCNCSGGSEWVHMHCFRQWQSHATSSLATQQAAQVCTVCRCEFQLQPLSLRGECLQKGTLLVFMDGNDQRPSNFRRSFILLLDRTERTTFGLIVNAPLDPRYIVPNVSASTSALPSCSCCGEISWRRGGPVCGGRLGVTRYFVAHTLYNLPTVSYKSQHLVSRQILSCRNDDDDRSQMFHRDLNFVYDETDLHSPAMFRGEELIEVIQSLTRDFSCQCQQQSQQQGSSDENQVSDSDLSYTSSKFLIFAGYCTWRGGMVEGEIKSGTWGVCNDTTLRDILQPEPWQDLRYNSARIQTYNDLLEEEERRGPTEMTE